MITMKAGRPLIDLAKTCYRANLPLLVIGPHGIGKSDLLTQAAAELKIDCRVFDLSLMEPPDLVGLPDKEAGRTVYFPPVSLPTKGKGFLVFEELNRSQQFMLAPCLQLLTARRLNEYILPKGWLPVAAINPPDDGYEVNELDPALLSRFVKVGVRADRDEWLAWARKAKVHPDVAAYVESDASVFEAHESNPRAWKYVSDLLLANDTGAASETIQVGVSGLVGSKRAGSFLAFRRNRVRPLNAEEILSGYAQHRDRLRGWVRDDGKLDLVEGSLLALETRLQSRTHFEAVRQNRKQWKHLGLFLRDLPGDLREQAEQFFEDHGYEQPRSRRTVP